LIAGLEELSQGEILVDGKPIQQLAAKERDIALLSQTTRPIRG
jgi:ABC-type sugar transport system ATPase subunit